MSDRMAAEIHIGGKVRRSVAEALGKAIATTGASLDWGEARFQPDTTDELLAVRSDDGNGPRLLKLFDDQACWGKFDTLETFLQEQGIPYCRYSEGKYDYDPETATFHSDCGLVESLTDHNRHPVVPTSELTPIAATLAKILAEMRSSEIPSEKLRRKLQRIHGKLRKCLPPEVPPLESFEIIED